MFVSRFPVPFWADKIPTPTLPADCSSLSFVELRSDGFGPPPRPPIRSWSHWRQTSALLRGRTFVRRRLSLRLRRGRRRQRRRRRLTVSHETRQTCQRRRRRLLRHYQPPRGMRHQPDINTRQHRRLVQCRRGSHLRPVTRRPDLLGKKIVFF